MTNNLGNKDTMAANLQYYMAKNNVTATDVCRALKFAPATFSDWLHARTYPRIDKIERLAYYFGITKADLIEERDLTIEKAPETVEISETKKKLYALIDSMSDEKAERLLAFLKE